MASPKYMLLFVICLASGLLQASADFDRVNQVRRQAGLPTLSGAPLLDDAAARHAAYLDRHRDPAAKRQPRSAHEQIPGQAGFSGASPAARALAAGYPHRRVLENVSMGYADADDAVDALMSAIYHRLTFLDFAADEMGLAVGERSRVFLLGRSDFDALCESPPPDALFSTPMDCLGQPMRRSYYDELCSRLPEEALFVSAHTVSCPNGARLDARFMEKVCEEPPRAARFAGHGRYFVPCDNGTRIDADWFLGLCEGRPPEALYSASGSYYEICDDKQRVDAEWFEQQCANLPEAARYTDSMRFRRPCSAPLDIRVEYLDASDAMRLDDLPEVVVWPPAGATDIPPAFFIEEPDPLPDLDVAGYPVSLQVNPQRVERVELQHFALFRLRGDDAQPLTSTRLLDKDSDPHAVLTAHQFALFPLDRLDWGARYRAVADLQLDGRPVRLAWEFTVRDHGLPLLTAAAASQRFVIQSGLEYLLYLPPTDASAHTVLSTRTEHRRGNRVNMELVDANTLRVRVEARYCDRIRMRFDGGREVELIPQGCAG